MRRFRSIRNIIDGVYRRAFLCVDWFLVPLENRVLNWYARKYPHRFRARLEACIEKGIQYFDAQPSFDLDSTISFTLFVNKTFEPKLAVLDQKIREFFEQWKDPHLRMLDRNYDSEKDGASCPNEFNLDELSAPERPLPKCLYADKLGLTEDFLAELEAIDDNGGYGTTHKLLGCVFLKTFSIIPHEAINPVLESTIAPIVRAQQRSRIGDIYSERTELLQWLGYEQYVQSAWILRIMRGQMKDGGWCWKRALFHRQTDQHPSCVAMTSLIQYREKHLKNGANKPQPPKLGQVLSLSRVSKVDGRK